MEINQQFEEVMANACHLALATSVNHQPNVRVLSFGYDPDRAGKLFFSTFRGNKKTEEFAQNPQVSCIPLPTQPPTDCQVRLFGVVEKSALTLDEFAKMIAQKAPEDAKTIQMGGDMLDIYEVNFTEAFVTLGMADAEKITL